MFELRPRLNSDHIIRQRLLERLPEESTYVVWLEAPYGYGKSVLASQWANKLEVEGRRVIWLASWQGEIREIVAEAIGLPREALWSHVLEHLWQEPTLLVIEDLEGNERFEQLLETPGDLILFASRRTLTDPGIYDAEEQRRLCKLEAEDLAFTKSEAEALADGDPRSQAAWELSQGWPLPFHYALLTGASPHQRALIRGVRASLSQASWEELLFLAALPYLPQSAATPVTERLVDQRFLYPLEGGYRLHPFVVEGVVEQHREDVQRIVLRESGRISPLLQGLAYEALAMDDALSDLLESGIETGSYLEGADAEVILRWDARLPEPRGLGRARRVGYALLGMSQILAGAEILEGLAETVGTDDPDTAVRALGYAAYHLASLDSARAMQSVRKGEALVAEANAVAAGVFYNNASKVFEEAYDLEKAEKALEAACAHLTEANPMWLTPFVNLMKIRWERLGDLSGYLEALHHALPEIEKHALYNYPDVQLELGRCKVLLGHDEEALAHFEGAQLGASAFPEGALEGQIEAAGLRCNLDALASLVNRAKVLGMSQLYTRMISVWAKALRLSGDPSGALRLLADSSRFSDGLERSLALYALGKGTEAFMSLPEKPLSRFAQLNWWAAQYLITNDELALQEILDLSLIGKKVLPGLIPLERLPKTRPLLAKAYPLGNVLESGWKAAIEERIDELPALEIEVLGHVRVQCLGTPLYLSGRLRELLTLIVLGFSKDVIIHSMWPEASEKKASNSFWVQHHALRRTLEPWGVPTYLEDTNLKHAAVDVWRLDAALKQHDAATVYALYRGPLAPEIDLARVETQRILLNEQVIEVLRAGARTANVSISEVYLRRILNLDPLDEPALRELLKAMKRSGRQPSAKRLLDAFVAHLKEETGLSPEAETLSILE